MKRRLDVKKKKKKKRIKSNPKKEYHLFLDLDGILIREGPGPRKCFDTPNPSIPRPHLHEFLEFCFEKFDHVHLWTAAERWHVHRNEHHWKGFIFSKIFTRDTDSRLDEIRSLDEEYYRAKPFEVIWDLYPESNSETSVLVDDQKTTLHDNPDNVLLIPEFTDDDDDELKKMMDKLSNWLNKARRK